MESISLSHFLKYKKKCVYTINLFKYLTSSFKLHSGQHVYQYSVGYWISNIYSGLYTDHSLLCSISALDTA